MVRKLRSSRVRTICPVGVLAVSGVYSLSKDDPQPDKRAACALPPLFRA